MDDFLVDIEHSQKRNPTTFSKIAFCFSILSIASMATLIINVSLILNAKGGNPKISEWVGGLTFFSMLLGLIFTTVSIVRKERIKYIKWIAAIINIGLLIFVMGLIIFSLLTTVQYRQH